ncbi:MAG: malto-oligosyltrehalose trehalohydrolase [Polyangia bacterium]
MSSPLGAVIIANGVSFRVWAPSAKNVEVVFESGASLLLEPLGDGNFVGIAKDGKPGDRYRYRLDERGLFPDPCSRSQPEGPHGPSEVVDPHAYAWQDASWRGVTMPGLVVYELHVGTFTTEGTFTSARDHLKALAELGVTLLEVMPVAEFSGRFNWGYDGVDLWAPFHGYGTPDDFRAFVDEAHRLGLGVILDVVYNHLGPDGNYLGAYSPDYVTDRYKNAWGESMNLDGPGSAHVREFFIENACAWIRDYHLDGLRLDAIQNIEDQSPRHLLGELSTRVRAEAAPRSIVLVAENELQQVRSIHTPESGGFGLDSMWNDDFHHSAKVALTGRREGYYLDYLGSAQELVSEVRLGFLFQGQHCAFQNKARGTLVRKEPASAFVHFLQNHDQVGNTLYGERIVHTGNPGRIRALTALLLLGPATPMLFQGQEYGATSPFHYFADHEPELSAAVHAGRRGAFMGFASYGTPEAQALVVDPSAEATFQASKLDRSHANPHHVALHKSLLALRRSDPTLSAQRRELVEGAVFGAHAFVLRWVDDAHGERLLVVNLGHELDLAIVAEPLLAPPFGGTWGVTWSSDDPCFGGPGAVHPCMGNGWRLPGESAVFLSPVHVP